MRHVHVCRFKGRSSMGLVATHAAAKVDERIAALGGDGWQTDIVIEHLEVDDDDIVWWSAQVRLTREV